MKGEEAMRAYVVSIGSRLMWVGWSRGHSRKSLSIAKNLPETVAADDERVGKRKQLLFSQPCESQKWNSSVRIHGKSKMALIPC